MTGIRRLADTKHKKGDKMLKFSYEDRHKYDDIINLPHHVSKTHPRMPIADRAAQFAPFAALTRHGEAVKETARLTESRIEIDESWKKVLDEKLQSLRKRCDEKPDVSATYFVPDTKKQGGAYVTVSGSLKKIDAYRRVLVLTDKTEVPIDEIIEIDSTVC